MSFEAFARMIFGPGLGTFGGIAVLWLIIWLAFKWVPKDEDTRAAKMWVNRGGLVVTILIVVGFGLYAINAASVNLIPRSELDRNDVERQTDEYQRRIQESKEAK